VDDIAAVERYALARFVRPSDVAEHGHGSVVLEPDDRRDVRAEEHADFGCHGREHFRGRDSARHEDRHPP
jgi:hypothetical protein